MIAGAMFCTVQAFAQSSVKRAAKDVGHGVSHAAKDVGHKTSEVASKGESAVVDKRYRGKYGPGGQTIYIDKHSRYYYVNKRGHHVYVSKAHLRNTK